MFALGKDGLDSEEDYTAAAVTMGLNLQVTRYPASIEQGGSEGTSAGDGGSGPAPPKAPLQAAILAKDEPLLKRLMKAGADLELRDCNGYTALHAAIMTWGKILRNWNTARPGVPNPLRRALANTELCLSALLEHGADANAALGHDSSHTALHMAVRYNVSPAVPLLISAGADVNAKDSHGLNPLHMACGTLQEVIVRSLIELGADVNAKLQSGNRPLHLTIIAAETTILQWDSRRRDPPGLGCVSALLRHGANPNAANRAGQTALHLACLYCQEALVEELLSHGADVYRRTRAGKGCLFLLLELQLNTRGADRLLAKLLCLILPRLPAGGAWPRSNRPHNATLRSLLAPLQQPRTLKDLCKNRVYLRAVAARGGPEGLRRILPDAVFDFVVNRWDSLGGVSLIEEEDSSGGGNCPSWLTPALSF